MDYYIGTIGYKITKFKSDVHMLLYGMLERVETNYYELTNLFKEYMASPYHIFAR